MKYKHIVTILYFLGAMLILPVHILAVENDECIECHEDSSLSRLDSKGVREAILLDYRKFKNSIHNINKITCVDCHADIEELNYDNEVPHKSSLDAVDCGKCHDIVEEAYGKGVHKNASRKGIDIQCYACHGYHYVTSTEGKSVLERENMSCLKCHNPYNFHEWLPQMASHFEHVECTVCHAPDTPRHIHLRVYDLLSNEFINPNQLLLALKTDIDGFMALLDKNENDQLDVAEFNNMVFMLKRRGVHITFHGELLSERQPIIHEVQKGSAWNV